MPSISATPISAIAIDRSVRRVSGSPRVTRASSAESIGEIASRNSTRATGSWLSAAMNPPEEIATHTATATPGEPDPPERRQHAPAVDDRDPDQQREAGEQRAAEDLRRRVERELALQHAGGGPGDRGGGDVELAAPAARHFERRRDRRHCRNRPRAVPISALCSAEGSTGSGDTRCS